MADLPARTHGAAVLATCGDIAAAEQALTDAIAADLVRLHAASGAAYHHTKVATTTPEPDRSEVVLLSLGAARAEADRMAALSASLARRIARLHALRATPIHHRPAHGAGPIPAARPA